MPMLKQLLQRKSAEARQSVEGQPLPVAANSRNLQSCPHDLRFRPCRGLTPAVVLRATTRLKHRSKRRYSIAAVATAIRPRHAASGQLRLFGQRILKLSRLVSGWEQDHLRSRPLELLQPVSSDPLVLHLEHPSLLPFPVCAKTDVPYYRAMRRLVDVVGHFVLVEPIGRCRRRGDDLHSGIGKRWQVV